MWKQQGPRVVWLFWRWISVRERSMKTAGGGYCLSWKTDITSTSCPDGLHAYVCYNNTASGKSCITLLLEIGACESFDIIEDPL